VSTRLTSIGRRTLGFGSASWLKRQRHGDGWHPPPRESPAGLTPSAGRGLPGRPRSIERLARNSQTFCYHHASPKAAATVAYVTAGRATNPSQFPLILESGSVVGSPTG
jgi:hypothetical protein